MRIRKVITLVDEARHEAGFAGEPPLRKAATIFAYPNRGRLNHRVGGLAAGDIKGLDGLV